MFSPNFSLESCASLLLIFPWIAHAYSPSTFLGPAFPAPVNLSNDSTIKSASEHFFSLVKDALNTGTSAHGAFDANSTAFSFEFFSITDEDPIYQYHYSPPVLADVPFGVKTVDRNSIYRIGSVTKLISVYTFLISDGDVHFHDPITKYIPELLAASHNTENNDPIHRTSWSDVTIGALASHMAGIGTEYGWLDISRLDFPFTTVGLPQLNPKEIPVCGTGFTTPPCSREDFLKGFAMRDPVFTTFQTPIYSNSAFQLLAYALESITGKDFGVLMEEGLFKPLNLSQTSYSQPDDSLGVILGNKTTTYWDSDLGDLWPTGGIWTSSRDLTTIGRSILRSSLLSQSQTRRWMKPLTHTSSLSTSIGAPWEIQRAKLESSGRVVDLYTKNGKIGVYGSYLILVPDYNIGFTMIAAGSTTNPDVLAGFTVDAFLPALEEAARIQAAQSYAGEYKVESDLTNSTFTLTTEVGLPGLGLANWISNGTALLPLFPIFTALGGGNVDDAMVELEAYSSGVALIDPALISVRLYPTGLRYSTSNGGQKISFRAVFGVASTAVDTSPFADTLGAWEIADAVIFGNSGLDEFIFAVDCNGKVTSVENPFLRQVLVKT